MEEVEPAPPTFWRAVGLTFEVTARNARICLILVSVYAGLTGAASAIGQTVNLGIDPTRATQGELAAVVAAGLAGIGTLVVVGIFVLPPTLGALCLLGSAAVVHDKLDSRGIVRHVLDRVLEVIGTFVLTLLVLLVAAIAMGLIALIVGVGVGAEAAFASLLFMSVLLSVPALYVVVRLSLAVPVVVLEGLGPVDALRRSWRLVDGVWLWVFGVLAPGIACMVLALGGWLVGFGGENLVLRGVVSAAVAAISATLLGVGAGVAYSSRAETNPPKELALPDAPAPEQIWDRERLPPRQ